MAPRRHWDGTQAALRRHSGDTRAALRQHNCQDHNCRPDFQFITYKDQKISDVYSRHEKEKQRSYLHRVLQIEKASFTPLVYSTNGGMAKEARRFHKKVAHMIADKTRESYSDVINCMGTKLTFAMLRSVLISVRGSRGKTTKTPETPLSNVSFNLIPEIQQYESY